MGWIHHLISFGYGRGTCMYLDYSNMIYLGIKLLTPISTEGNIAYCECIKPVLCSLHRRSNQVQDLSPCLEGSQSLRSRISKRLPEDPGWGQWLTTRLLGHKGTVHCKSKAQLCKRQECSQGLILHCGMNFHRNEGPSLASTPSTPSARSMS